MSTERSNSRGRMQSTGRGGRGNIRPESLDRVISGPDDISDTRGREPVARGDPDQVISTGRGGRGNIRSPSRDSRGDAGSVSGVSPARSDIRGRQYDRETIASIDETHVTGMVSHGRGGLGNMSGERPSSMSRSRSREPAAQHGTGRGGLGNMVLGGPSEKDIEEQDESERSSHSHELGVHSVGRGGYANMTPGELPYTEGAVNPHGANHPHATHTHLVDTFGRGGLGNNNNNIRTTA